MFTGPDDLEEISYANAKNMDIVKWLDEFAREEDTEAHEAGDFKQQRIHQIRAALLREAAERVWHLADLNDEDIDD